MSNYPINEFAQEIESKGLSLDIKIRPLLISSKALLLNDADVHAHLDNLFTLEDIADVCGYDVEMIIDFTITLSQYMLSGDFNVENLLDVHNLLQMGLL